MKIECDICQTVFLIDDNLISDKGIKAQCPRCGDQKVVRRPPPADDFLSEPAPLGGGSPLDGPLFTADAPAFMPHQFTSDASAFSSSSSLSGGFGAVSGPSGFGPSGQYGGTGNDFAFAGSADDIAAELACFKCGRPIPESTDSVLPVCENCRGETANYSPMESYSEELPLSAGGFGRNAQPVSYDVGPPEAAYSPFGDSGSSASLNPGPDYIPSHSLPPNDRAPRFGNRNNDNDNDHDPGFGGGNYEAGMDFGHEYNESQLPLGKASQHLDEGNGRLDPTWIKVRRISDGQIVGPVSLAEIRSLYVHGKLSMDDEYSGQDGVWFPIHQVPELMVILRRTPQLGSGGAAISSGGGRQNVLMWLLAILLLGGGGATAWVIWSNSNQSSQVGPTKRAPVKLTSPSQLFREKITQWKRSYPGIKADPKASQKFVKEGLIAMATDVADGYTKALASFAKALLAQESNQAALAGFCLSTLWSPNPQQSSARLIGECYSLLKQKTKSTSPPLSNAVYALYLARRSSHATAQRYVTRARKRAPKDGYIQLIYGSLLHAQKRSLLKANKALDLAIQANSSLAKAQLLRAKSAMATQHFARAATSLKVLEEQNHPKGLMLMADFHILMGNFKNAEECLQKIREKQPTHIKSWIKLGALQYQLLGKRKAALKLLTTPPALGPGRELPRFYQRKQQLHLGYIALLQKDTKAVALHTKALLQLSPNTSDTQLFLVQAWAAQNQYAQASKRMQSLLNQLNEAPYRTYATLLKARIGKVDEAIAELRQLIVENSAYIWPRLALPALLCLQQKNVNALLELKKATNVEPDYLTMQRKPTDYFFVPNEWLALKNYFLRIKASRDERAIFKAAAGIVAYHTDRKGEASALLRSARNIDVNGMSSNLYLAQIALERGSYGSAASYAKRVYANYDENPTAALILAHVAFRKKQYDKALGLYRLVRRERPWFLSAKIQEATILILQDKQKEAKDILEKLLISQQQHHLMARALYKLKW